MFASLAKDPKSRPYRRWLAVVAAMAPFVGSTVGAFASGLFASMSTTVQIALGVVGLMGLASTATRRESPSLPLVAA